MRDAREQGATWDQIAEALGLTDAEAARAYYLNAIEHQERYVGDLHEPAALGPSSKYGVDQSSLAFCFALAAASRHACPLA